jgi:hypothetical protein
MPAIVQPPSATLEATSAKTSDRRKAGRANVKSGGSGDDIIMKTKS